MKQKRNRAVAALFSILAPGLGHLYIGKTKCAVFWFAWFAVWLGLYRTVGALGAWWYLSIVAFMSLSFFFVICDSVLRCPKKAENLGRFQKGGVYFLAWLLSVIINVATSFVGTSFRTYNIPAGSMSPTLIIGDNVIVDESYYDKHKPRRGDVVVFTYPKDHSLTYIKRIVGLPGDVITINEKRLFINGQPTVLMPLSEQEAEAMFLKIADSSSKSYSTDEFNAFRERLDGSDHIILNQKEKGSLDFFGSVKVPEGHYFVLGDDRDFSNDSRVWGFLDGELLRGKGLFIIFNRKISFEQKIFRISFDRTGNRL